MRRWVSVFAGSAVWAAASAALAWSGPSPCTLRVPGTDTTDPTCGAAALDAPAISAPTGGWIEPVSPVQARHSLGEAERLLGAGDADDAILHLRVVELAMPAIADRLALRRADALMRVGAYVQACEAYEGASESDNRDVAVRARVGAVRCLLDAGERAGEERLRLLLRRYPHMGARLELKLALARAKERWGARGGAVSMLRSLDLQYPASPEAAEARRELERLRAEGQHVAPFSPTERYDRAERLFRNGPNEEVEAELARLFEEKKLTGELRGRAHLLAARVARDEGDWDAVRTEIDAARRHGVPVADAARVLPPPAPAPVPEDAVQAERDLERRIQGIVRGRRYQSLSNTQLKHLLDLAVRYDRTETADGVLDAMRGRETYTPSMRYQAALTATGVASDATLAALLETVVESRQLQVSGRYHYARALERVGRYGEAEARYLDVIALDRSATGWYAMWAEQRLWAMQSEASSFCAPPLASPEVATESSAKQAVDVEDGSPDSVHTAACLGEGVLDESAGFDASGAARGAEPPTTPPALAQVDAVLAENGPVPLALLFDLGEEETPAEGLDAASVEALAPADPAAGTDDAAVELRDEGAPPDREAILALLAPIAAAHGEAYPWLRRARDLVSLDLLDAAADELHESFLAWRDAQGRPRMRAGLESVFSGNPPPRYPADHATRRARLALDPEARRALAGVARMLGDPGTALGFGLHGVRPRAYSDAVEHAARKYGLDPNLLFAVMRVESVFHRRIVSYAGAIGLMQIMPRTGQRIAQRLGVEAFEVSDLLDPETNVEFSAWYLASLLERFDGSLPLAIASYNGGPHNVRLWMREHTPSMPLDTFLEHIPFTQTHRYVRRVLTHYAAYRAQQNLPMARLDVALPGQRPDRVAF